MVLLLKNVKKKQEPPVKDGEILYILLVKMVLLIGYVVYVLLNVLITLEMMGYIVLNLELTVEELVMLYGMKINVMKKIKM